MTIKSSTVALVNDAVVIQSGGTSAVPGAGAVGVNVGAGFTGTLVFEAQIDGSTWFGVMAYAIASGVVSGLPVPSTTTSGQFVIPVYGYDQVRVRVSVATSGSATVSLETSASPYVVTSVGTNGVQNVQTGLADTIQASATASAPGAGVTVVTITPGTAGVWEISYATGLLSGTPAAADAGNMKLLKNAAVLLAAIPVPGALGYQPGPAGPIRVTLAGTDTITIAAVGAATAAVVYGATLIAKRVA